jgi:hypothetical protein
MITKGEIKRQLRTRSKQKIEGNIERQASKTDLERLEA